MNDKLYNGDALDIMSGFESDSFDVVWADPPYFLSSGGSTCRNGKRVSVDKGAWDTVRTPEDQMQWSTRWILEARRVLKSTGTLWVCGSMHSVHSSGYALQLAGLRLLNEITWQKPNPPPNLGCRCFTHSHETLLWASKGKSHRHFFDYDRMKLVTGKQMKDVWQFPAPGKSEKTHGKHPTQKPVALVERCLLASLPSGACVLDPFMGSGTTGVAAALHPEMCWSFVGIDADTQACAIAHWRMAEAQQVRRLISNQLQATSTI
jgi:site-specific DNA-methyltransferase (adenine-specific)